MRRKEVASSVEPLRAEELARLRRRLWVEDWIGLNDSCEPAHECNAADGLGTLASRRIDEAVLRGCRTGALPRRYWLASREQRMWPRWRNREEFMHRWHEAQRHASGAPAVAL